MRHCTRLFMSIQLNLTRHILSISANCFTKCGMLKFLFKCIFSAFPHIFGGTEWFLYQKYFLPTPCYMNKRFHSNGYQVTCFDGY